MTGSGTASQVAQECHVGTGTSQPRSYGTVCNLPMDVAAQETRVAAVPLSTTYFCRDPAAAVRSALAPQRTAQRLCPPPARCPLDFPAPGAAYQVLRLEC